MEKKKEVGSFKLNLSSINHAVADFGLTRVKETSKKCIKKALKGFYPAKIKNCFRLIKGQENTLQ